MGTNQTVVRGTPGPGGGRWWLVVLLVIIILAILAAIFYTQRRSVFGIGAATSTPTATPTVVPGPTGTPVTGPTATPGPSPTPGGPTSTPGGPTPTAGTLHTGQITHPQHQIQMIQQQANAGNGQYTYYLNSYQVIQHNLPTYGFTAGQFTIVSPGASPTPTPYTSRQNLPQVEYKVKFQGATYGVYLDQPVQQGPKGIWVIITIRPCANAGASC